MRVTAAAPKAAKAVSLTVKADGEDRLRLHNLSPLKGSRKARRVRAVVMARVR